MTDLEQAQATIETLTQTNTDLVARVGVLETNNKDLTEQRKVLQGQLKDGSGDESLKAELENYKTQLEGVEADKESLKHEYSQEINSMRMMTQLKELGVETHNADALSAVSELVLGEATAKDGGFVFLKEDGTTRFNQANQDYSIQDKINDLRESDKSYLFKQPTGGGKQDTPNATPGKKSINDVIDAGLKY